MIRWHLVLVILGTWLATAPCYGEEETFRCDELERDDYLHAQYQWQSAKPLEYLNYLRSLSVESVTVYGCKEDWVTEQDVPYLLELLDSKEPCPNQMSSRSSIIGRKRSTVGNEAAWLIQAFRVGRFPPGLNSTQRVSDPNELRRWWEQRQGRSNLDASNTSTADPP